MNSTDKKITDVLSKFGEPMAGNVWRVQGTAVIYHKALERIAAQAGITFDPPEVIRAERDEAVILVTGRMYRTVKVNEQLGNGDTGEVFDNWVEKRECRSEWSFGEALIGANYRVSGKQAAYVFAMAEKRAKDRVILKLIELSGEVYSEEEADEFKQSAPSRAGADQAGGEASNRAVSSPAAPGDPFGLPPIDEPTESQTRLFADLKARFEECTSMAALDEKVKKAVPEIESLTDEQKDRLRKALRFVREALRPRVVS